MKTTDLKLGELPKQPIRPSRAEASFQHWDVLEVDHLIPRALGGKDEYKNLQLLHRHCYDEKTVLDLKVSKLLFSRRKIMLAKKLAVLAVLSSSLISGFAIYQTSVSAQTVQDVTLWDQQIGKGASFNTNKAVPDLSKLGFNNRASAIQVNNGQKWRFYAGKNFTGEYIDVGPNSAVGNLGKLNNKVSSLKAIR